MKDWKGYNIKVGDNVLVVAVKNPFEGDRAGIIIMYKGGNRRLIQSEEVIPKSYFWNVQHKYKIMPANSDNQIIFEKIGTILLPVNLLDFSLCIQPWEILCIEGISDDEQEYYTAKFS